MRRLLLALLCVFPMAAHGQVVSQGPTISVTTGVQPFPITAAQSQFLAPDNSPQFFVGLIPGAAEYWDAMGGLTGNGATLLATNGATGPVSGNFAAQETGAFRFGNGSGTLFEIDDPGGVVVNWLTVTPSISGTARAKLATSAGGWQLDSPNAVTSQITQNGQVAVEFGTTGTAATGTSWMRFSSAGGGLATQQCLGSATTTCFFQANGNGGAVFADAAGNLAVFAQSSAGTAVQSVQIRAASATDPVMMTMSGGNIAMGGVGGSMASALSTSATTGFAGIPTVAGTPTGVPAQAEAGVAYLVFDSTNLKLCAYVTAWHCSAAFP